MTSKYPTVAGAAEAQGSMTRQQMLDFFKHREDAHDDLDAAALAADYAENAVIESPTAGVHTGPEAAERTFRVIFSAFLDLTTKVESLIIDGNSAVRVVSLEGTHIGE
ncbi:MAG TPA: nuclear transport factor 2 family protein, partial [Vicinamibacterales bacterium]|nr:nuclear transport factor 2 family protein [Vicinamibacterales bacterium]